MDKVMRALTIKKHDTYKNGGYTDLLSIIGNLLYEYDDGEEMDRETAEQLFSDVLDSFYAED